MANGNGKNGGGGAVGWIVGGVAVVAVSVAAFFGYQAMAKASTPEKKAEKKAEEKKAEEKKAEEKKAGTTTTTTTTTVPAKTQTPYNKTMFAKSGDAVNVLRSLAPKYVADLIGVTSTNSPKFVGMLGRFQKDWNAVAKAKDLTPISLNSSRLTVDGKIGTQSRRAMEWAQGMGWIQALTDAGVKA